MALKAFLVRCCVMGLAGLVSISAHAGAPAKTMSFDQILKMHESAARHERVTKTSANLSATLASSCTIGGGRCSFDSDCCSDNCHAGTCQAGSGGCTIGGGSCSFDSDCCSDNCHAGTCQAGSGKCSDGGAHCSFDSDCCSGNCYAGTCQSACTTTGDACTYDHECCGGNCNSVGRCGVEPDPNCR